MQRRLVRAILVATTGVCVPAVGTAQSRTHTLMPVPATVSFDDGSLPITPAFRIALRGHADPRLARAAERATARLARVTGLPIGVGLPADRAGTLVVETEGAAGEYPALGDDESYALVVTTDGARLSAATPWGALHGLETFLQLVEPAADGFQVPAVHIADRPRFPWRGLLMDVARHWIPPDVIERNLDAMAAVKLNVLHWHLSEDQGFRVESRRFPRLQAFGSDGLYYTQEEIRGIVRYAADRGLRVVPEFDVPGHTTSWLVGYPELAAAPGPYAIERKWGVFDPTMDPTRDTAYAFLDAFFGEMGSLFPDRYLHIGGDEVNGKQWSANPAIARFKRQHGLAGNDDLQAYFNRKLLAILSKHGKRMVGWDEIFHPDLPRDIVVQSWRGPDALADAAGQGYQGILSNGYYLDHMRSAAFHYGNDPLAGRAADLPPEARERILGGEACMWAEFVSAETVDSRIWPRTAAIAERLWSPAEVTDVDDMYRRLEVTSHRLDWLGVTHRSGYPLMLARLTGAQPIAPLQTLADVLEPVKNYARPRSRDYTSLVPLNRLVDAARPESDVARRFAGLVDRYSAGDTAAGRVVAAWLERWRDNDAALGALLDESPLLEEVRPLAADLRAVAAIGLAALRPAEGTAVGDPEEWFAALDRAAEPKAELLLVIVPAVRRLVEISHPVGGP
jgi:hexosaminidase